MQTNKILSIIIPVYNIENFISDCIYSIENQGIIEELEIICVDDGSTDSSKEKIKNLQEHYNNIVLVEQENSGVSAARNRGTEIVNGEYIWFIDGDDYLVDGCIPSIVNHLKNNPEKLPIVLALKGVDENTHNCSLLKPLKFRKRAYRPPSGPYAIILPTKIAKLYPFDNELSYGEDYYWTFWLTKSFKKCYTASPFVYCYRTRHSSAMNTTSPEATQKKIDSFIKLYYRYDQIEKHNKPGKFIFKELSRRKRQCIQACLLTLIGDRADYDTAKSTMDFLKQNKLYPYFFIFQNLLPRKNFKEFRVNILSFLLPIKPYFWLLYKMVKK